MGPICRREGEGEGVGQLGLGPGKEEWGAGFGPCSPKGERGRREERFSFSFFKPNFQIYFQIEILYKFTFCC